MVQLKELMVDSRDAWIDYPTGDGFSVLVCNLSRPELRKLTKKCTSKQYDRSARTMVEKFDDDKFVEEFAKAVIKDWKGLTLEQLNDLVLIDLEGQDPKTELPYSQEHAEALITNSTEFDNWLNEVAFDLSNFRS